jgi:hypothetical protein
MDSCFKTSDNKHLQCPPRMADGRHFTDYRSSYYINDLIRADNNISNSLQYRLFLQQNADSLMNRQREIACSLNCCGPCPMSKESFVDYNGMDSSMDSSNTGSMSSTMLPDGSTNTGSMSSTMLPEQYKFVTDGRTAKMVLNDVNGLGVGRQYYTYPRPTDACNNLPSAWPAGKTNMCQSPNDRLNYLGDMQPTPSSLRQAIPGGGIVMNA